MQWVILIGNHSFSLYDFSKMTFEHSRKIHLLDHELHVIYDNDSYAIFYEDDNSIKNDYEFSDLEKLPFKSPKMIMLKYNDIEILKNIISEENFPKDIIIDCDGVDLGLEKVFDRQRIIVTHSPANS